MILVDTWMKMKKVAWFLPGFLLYAAYPPMREVTDVLFALAPLMWLSRREASARTVAKRWFQSGIFFWIATLSWMPAIVKNNGPWPLVVLGWIGLAAYCSLYFWLYGYLSASYWSWARQGNNPTYWKRLLGVLFVEPVLWCGLELIRCRFLGGFAWNPLGVVAVNSGFGAPAALGGVYLCSAVILLINGTIAGIAERVWRPERSGFANLKRRGILETLLAFGIIAGIYSQTRWNWREGACDGDQLKVAMIQRNFPCCFQSPDEDPVEVYSGLLDKVAYLKPDLVVLSESAMCEFGPVDSTRAKRAATWALKKANGTALLAGGSRAEGERLYNSAALYQRPAKAGGREPVQIYDKVHLVPFGEFIPGDKWLTVLQKLAPVGSCTPGELKLLRLRSGHPLGVAICFEDTDSAQMRALAKMGARALVFITNDSWFSQSVESEQHAWQAVARAIETGLPVVRVGNSGVTGTIAPSGRPAWLADEDGRPLVDRQGTLFDRIGLAASGASTVYVCLGDVPLMVFFALLIVGMILVKYRSYVYEKRRRMSLQVG